METLALDLKNIDKEEAKLKDVFDKSVESRKTMESEVHSIELKLRKIRTEKATLEAQMNSKLEQKKER